MIAVVKYGGAAMEDLALQREVSSILASYFQGQRKGVVVHGGGKELTRWLERSGVESRFINGLRYTDEETLEIAEMVFSGLINKRLVSALNEFSLRAVGLSGRDARIFRTRHLPELGFVGEVEQVNVELLQVLLQHGFTPCIASIGEDSAGHPLNINADEVARAVAESLRAEELIYLSDVDGLRIGGTVLERVSLQELRALISHPEVSGGMIPKLQGTLHALSSGVKRVRFLNGTKVELLKSALLGGVHAGTSFHAE